jgi:thiamine-phosphate pyrophosphorylase
MGEPPPLHVLATTAVAARADFEMVAVRMVGRCGSGLALHLRLPEAPGRELHRLADTLGREAHRHGGWLVVNERLDVALGAAADAVQLGRDALPIAAAHRLAAGRLALGASVHGRDEAVAARRDGANFLILGTIFATPTHGDVQPGGLTRIEACRELGLPVIAIGGVEVGRVPDVLRAGASGVAVVRAVWSSSDPVRAAEELLAVLRGRKAP